MKKMMEESQEFKNVDKETALAAGKLLGINVVMEKTLEQEGEEIDMCTGLKEWLLEERSEGRTEGISLMSKLALKLNEDGRLNDLVKAAMDSKYQQELLQEYNLD